MRRTRGGWRFLPLLAVVALTCSKEPEARKIKLAPSGGGEQAGLRQRTEATLQLDTGERKTIVVTYFDNLTGERELDWLRKGVTDMLIADLSQSRQLSVVSHEGLLNILRRLGQEDYASADVRVAALVAREAKAEAWLTGALRKRGDSLRIEARLYDAQRGELLKEDSVAGEGMERIFTMVDELSRKVKEGLQLSLRDARERALALADVTTTSVQAYRHYITGLEQQYKLYVERGAAEFQEAIRLDSTFAMAYLQLAYAYGTLGKHQQALEVVATGLRRGERASAKERLALGAYYHMLTGNVAEAFRLLEEVIKLDPYDKMIHYALGSWSYSVGWTERAIGELEKTIAVDPGYKIAYNLLGYAYARLGRFQEATAALKKYRELAPEEPNPYDSMGEVYQMMGQDKKAMKMFKKALRLNPRFYDSARHIAMVCLEQGKYRQALQAQTLYRAVAPTREIGVDSYVLGVVAALRAGSPHLASAYLDTMRTLNPVGPVMPFVARLVLNDRALVAEADRQWFEAAEARFPQLAANPNWLLSSTVLAIRYGIRPYEFSAQVVRHLARGIPPEATSTLAALQPAMIVLGHVEELSRAGQTLDPRSMTYAPDLGSLYWEAYALAMRKSPAAKESLLDWLAGAANFAAETGNQAYALGFKLCMAFTYHELGQAAEAEAILRELGFPGETHWHCLGPFENVNGFNRRYIAENAKRFPSRVRYKDQTLQWQVVNDGLADGFIDLWSLFDKPVLGAAYARLEFSVPTTREAELRFGYRAGMRVWLNGKQVWFLNGSERTAIDRWKVPVTLKEGRNIVLLKCTQGVGEWGFYFRITDEQGNGFADIEYLTP